MTNYSGRKAIHVYVSDQVHNAWHDTAAELGINVSALIEVMGLNLDLIVSEQPATRLSPRQLVTDARQLAYDRRQRKERVL